MAASITSVEFRNYKALRHFSLSLQEVNILVGPNNCGKSTIIGAFRVLAAGLRKARSQPPQQIVADDTVVPGYQLPGDLLDISTENIHTDYAAEDTTVAFRLSNGNKLRLLFPTRGDCSLIPEAKRRRITSPTAFKSEFPISVGVVPVLGPLEHEEPVVKPSTVQRNLHTHRASRHFRNFWHYYPDGFPEFAELVASTWPGMEIEAPEAIGEIMVMFCREHRITRELFWSGFGFQIWCQLLTHLSRGSADSILIVDEPEVYLHPDVQRQLLSILRKLGPSVVIATHSTEIMGEADPSEIVLVDKAARSGERLKDATGIQAALELIGSLQNIALTRLARSRRVIFVEGDDFSLISKFAGVANLPELAAGSSVVPVPIDGFSGWRRIRDITEGINRTMGKSLLVAAVLDRDYFPDDEIEAVRRTLSEHAWLVHIHERKEIENYLLVPSAIERAIRSNSRQTPETTAGLDVGAIEELIVEITEPMKNDILGQLISKRWAFSRNTGVDQAAVAGETASRFEKRWNQLESRLSIVSGKEVLKRLREAIQNRYGVTLSNQRVLGSMRRSEISEDLMRLLTALDEFRRLDPCATRGL